jgi:plastocyanin
MKAIASIAALALTLCVSQVALASPNASAGASKTATVNIDNFVFKPHKLNVTKGTTVVFTNSSGFAHTATDKGAFDTGRIKAGHSASVRFAQKGTFSYVCKIHPEMHGKIVVG